MYLLNIKNVKTGRTRGIWFLGTKPNMFNVGESMLDSEFRQLQVECRNGVQTHLLINKATNKVDKFLIGSPFCMHIDRLVNSLRYQAEDEHVKGYLSLKSSIQRVTISEDGNDSVIVNLDWEDKTGMCTYTKFFKLKDIVEALKVNEGKSSLEIDRIPEYHLNAIIKDFNKLGFEPVFIDIIMLESTILKVQFYV